MSKLLKPSLDWLLVFVPVTIWLEHGHKNEHVWIFLSACLSILPLAGWLGHATEHLSSKTGESIGGLLNATFGNAAELIIAISALRQGLYEVVKASLTGSIIGNILLVAGLSMFAGGLKHKTQSFNPRNARVQATLLLLAAISLVVPAMFHAVAGPAGVSLEDDLALEISIVLLAVYAASLVFSLVTHKKAVQRVAFFRGSGGPGGAPRGSLEHHTLHRDSGSRDRAHCMDERILVGSVEQAAHSFGMTRVFVGVIVVAIIGNAAEHSTAILVALKNRMDLSMSIAMFQHPDCALCRARARAAEPLHRPAADGSAVHRGGGAGRGAFRVDRQPGSR